jgi:two-component system NtrC family sensor kinase
MKSNLLFQSFDMGRVLLNLFNNVFYSVSEKKREKGDEHDPKVSVTSKMMGDKVEI